MIERLKIQSFSLKFVLGFVLCFLLVIFFVYSYLFQLSFFPILALILTIHLILCGYYNSHLIKKQTTIDLAKQDYLEKANLLEAELQQKASLVSSLKEKIVSYFELKGFSEKLYLSVTLQDTSQTLTGEVLKFFDSEATVVLLYLFHHRSSELRLAYAQKKDEKINVKAKNGDLYDYWVVKTLKPLLIEDIKKDFRFDVEKIEKEEIHRFRSLMSVPLIVGNKIIGILRVDSQKENTFAMEDLRLLTTIADLTAIAIENAQLFHELEELATHDSLTGLLLRRFFLERLSQELTRALRRKKELSLLMVDLDHFKEYNDRFGHTAGDRALKTVAMILNDIFKDPGNIICRYGGEEFVVLLTDCPKKVALTLARKLREAIEQHTIYVRREKSFITVSVGMATFPQDAQMKEELIQKADEALYQAKRQGRNRVCIA